MAPPHDLIPDRVEHTLGLHTACSTPYATLEKRLCLGSFEGCVAAGGSGYPAVAPGIACDCERAFRRQGLVVSPDRGEFGVWRAPAGRTGEEQRSRQGDCAASSEYHTR
jgi:hypothetical protein